MSNDAALLFLHRVKVPKILCLAHERLTGGLQATVCMCMELSKLADLCRSLDHHQAEAYCGNAV